MAASPPVSGPVAEEVTLDLTPMIDVVFLLLIFFIVTMKFRLEEGLLEAKLPDSLGQGRAHVTTLREQVRIRIHLEHSSRGELVELARSRMSVVQFYSARGAAYAYSPVGTDFDLVLSVGNAPTLRLKQVTAIGPQRHASSTLRLYRMDGREVPDAAILVDALRRARDTFDPADRELTPVIIDPDRSATYSSLTFALKAAKEAGFEVIQFAGKLGPD